MLHGAILTTKYLYSTPTILTIFVYWTFVYDTYAFWAEQTCWPSMTRSREFPITPVWIIVRFLQVNFIEKIKKLHQKAVRYSVLTGYGLFRVFLQRIIRKKLRTTEIVRFREVFGFIRVRLRQVWLYMVKHITDEQVFTINICIQSSIHQKAWESRHKYSEILMLLVSFHGSVHNDRIPNLI